MKEKSGTKMECEGKNSNMDNEKENWECSAFGWGEGMAEETLNPPKPSTFTTSKGSFSLKMSLCRGEERRGMCLKNQHCKHVK